MSDKPKLIHATLVSLGNNGILLLGPSGSGKSDLALRFILTVFPPHFASNQQHLPELTPHLEYGELVADDQVSLTIRGGQLWGCAPDNLKGLIEVRHLGIRSVPYKRESPITQAIMLKNHREIERYPDELRTYSPLDGVTLPLKDIDPFEPSAICKLFLACINDGS